MGVMFSMLPTSFKLRRAFMFLSLAVVALASASGNQRNNSERFRRPAGNQKNNSERFQRPSSRNSNISGSSYGSNAPVKPQLDWVCGVCQTIRRGMAGGAPTVNCYRCPGTWSQKLYEGTNQQCKGYLADTHKFTFKTKSSGKHGRYTGRPGTFTKKKCPRTYNTKFPKM